MHKGPRGPLMNAANILTSVWPHSTAKRFAQASGCSPRQAKRVLTTGRVPRALTKVFVAVLDREIEKNRQHMEALGQELREIAVEEMLGRAASRREKAVGQAASLATGSADEANQLALTLPENGEGC